MTMRLRKYLNVFIDLKGLFAPTSNDFCKTLIKKKITNKNLIFLIKFKIDPNAEGNMRYNWYT